ncbi:Serine/threonine-protein kinase [Lachnellula hyalina]|uniref:Aurora kinase n=1 Tax=Lachnellula hyalina TaxID=1316788 RepID=A0A8H8QWK7_9HELO|nr:Serine/threonine-protein kinase [Lachnellula hyalina]TVY23436.1 Serine/threonine-protein kinase [Lachnellula hyalina]
MESARDVEAEAGLANTTHDPNAEHKLQNHEDPSSARTSQPSQNTHPTNTVDTALKTPDADNAEASNNPSQPSTQPPTAQPKQFNLSMLEIGELLGNGAYGTVHLARERDSSPTRTYALKTLSKAALARLQTQHPLTEWEQIQRQIDMPGTLHQRNIMRCHGRFEDATNVYLVLELTQKRDLYKRLQEHKAFPEADAARYIAGVVAALQYLHSRHVIHRDLKPEHLRLGTDGEVKISGFKWAVFARPPEYRRRTLCGTLDYLPPEMLKSASESESKDHDAYTSKVDLWGLGVLVYEFLVGEAPFKDLPAVTQKRIEGLDFTVPGSVGGEAGDLIRKLLVLDPDKRLSLDEVRKHPWITKYTGPEADQSTVQEWELV